MNLRRPILLAFAATILAGIQPVLARVSPSPVTQPKAAPGYICCHYYSGFGKWEYDRMQEKDCTSFPIDGDVVSDDKCQSEGCQKK